jgi:4-amino-4-deoxy-L-arabinose transferase-like glycosyltransferase
MPEQEAAAPQARRPWWQSPWIGALLVLLAAACLRYPGLEVLPPGFNFDEGGEGVAAMDVVHGHLRAWWPIGGGKEPLMAYLSQPFLLLFGQTRLALRLYTATLGVIAAVGTFWLGWETLGQRQRSLLIPLAAGLGLATAFWHVAYSRIAFRALAMPAVEALALAWLWRALNTRRRSDFIGAGALIGLGAYTYLAGRFVPVGLALFFLLEALLAWRERRWPLLLQEWRHLLLAGLAALIVFLPLGLFFFTHPGSFVERAGSVSIFSPDWNQGDFWGTLLHTTLTTVGSWAGMMGDPNPLANIPGKPMLALPLAPLFWLGLLLCLLRVGRAALGGERPDEEGSALPVAVCLFALSLGPVMLLPGILAPEGAPHHLRIIGTAPLTYLLVGIGLDWLLGALRAPRYLPRWVVSVVLPVALFLGVGAATAVTYTQRWATLPDLYMAFDVYALELAETMTADQDIAAAYVIPMDQRAAHEARHYTLDYLYAGARPYTYLPVDEADAADILTQAAAGHERLKLVRWTQDKHAAADERELVTFLLVTAGARLVEDVDSRVYHIETWQLPSPQTGFRLPSADTALDANFDGLLQLRGAAVMAVGDQVGGALRWAPLAPMDVDYKASVRLTAADGSRVTQVDRFLRHNWHQGTSLWPAEEVNEYYLLPAPGPGAYEVSVVVYHPETLAPLVADGLAEVPVGSVVVVE